MVGRRKDWNLDLDKNSTNSPEPPRDRKKEKNIQHTGNIPLDQIYDVSPPPPFILG
jgi:hypothetical protein